MNSHWIDAHSHLSHKKLNPELVKEWVASAHQKHIVGFIQGGIDPSEWSVQEKIHQKYPGKIFCVFGIHPWFVTSDLKEEELPQILKTLHEKLPKAVALGELGLDYSEKIDHSKNELQKKVFQLQLEMAQELQKPLVLHVVGGQAHEEALQILKKTTPKFSGIVHSYSGSLEQSKKYLDLDLTLSVGTLVLRKNAHELHTVVQKTPLTQLVVETDCPDQPPPHLKGQLNPPESLISVAQKIAELKSVSYQEVLDQSQLNLIHIFKLEKIV